MVNHGIYNHTPPMDNRSFWHCLAVLWICATVLPLQSAAQSRVEGRVIDADTREPVAQANMIFRQDRETEGTATDARGRFQITLAPGEYTVEVSALGYQDVRRTVTVDAEAPTTVEFELVPREYNLNEVVVTEQARRTPQTATTVQQIDPQAIEQQDAADVSELAALAPATHVQTNSRGQTILYFRNAGDRQVGQFFDGALLNIPWDNRVDISQIPASVVEDMTVTKGAPSVQYGANVLGGAVNFQSRTLDVPGRKTEFKGQLGSAGQGRGTVTHLGRTDQWDYTASLQYTTRGDQPLPDDADLENNQPDDDRRVNTDRDLISGFGRAARRFEGGGELAVSVLHVDVEQGVAPEGNEDNPGDTRFWRRPLWQKTTVMASGQFPFGSQASLRGAAWGSRFAQDIAQFESIAYETLDAVQEDRDQTFGLRLIGTQELPVGTATLSFNGLTSRHDQTNVPHVGGAALSDSVSVFRQHIFSVGGEYEVELHPRVQASAGLNLDGTATPNTGPFPDRDPFTAWGFTGGVRVDVAAGTTVRASGGRKSRFPTMRELFGAALGKFVPNPGLSPVTAWIGELGVEHQTETLSLGATGFVNRVFDTIDKRSFQSGPNAGKEQRVNLEGARIWGIETTARWAPDAPVTVDGHLTWSRPRAFEESETVRLDEKPELLGTWTVTADLPAGVSLMGQVRYTDRVYARNDANEFVRLPSSVITDARIGYDLSGLSPTDEGELFVRVDNLLDDAKFIGLGLPGPGRSIRAGAEFAF